MSASTIRFAASLSFAAWAWLFGTAASTRADVQLQRIALPGGGGATAQWGVSGQITDLDGNDHLLEPPTSGASDPTTLRAQLPFNRSLTVNSAYIGVSGSGDSNMMNDVGALVNAAVGSDYSVTDCSWTTPWQALEFSGGCSTSQTARYKIFIPNPAVNYKAVGDVVVTVTGQASWASTQGSSGGVRGPGITSFSATFYCGTITPSILYTDADGQEHPETEPYESDYSQSFFGLPAASVVGPEWSFEVGSSSSAGGHAIAGGWGGENNGRTTGFGRYSYRVP